VAATFEGGAFKPEHGEELEFSDGQRVTLTIETVSSAAPLSATLADDLGLLSRSAWELQRPSEFRSRLAALEADTDLKPSRTNKVLKGLNDAIEDMTAPRIVVEAIKDQFKMIVAEVRNIKPIKPRNRMQENARKAVAVFNNLSSLLVYIILIAATLKLLFLFAANNTKIVAAIESAKYTSLPLILILILVCMLAVRGLHKISAFVRSYRIMAIFGCLIAIKLLIKTTIVLFTATSLTGMGIAAWQLLSGVLK
jgi:hypothetical protein